MRILLLLFLLLLLLLLLLMKQDYLSKKSIETSFTSMKKYDQFTTEENIFLCNNVRE